MKTTIKTLMLVLFLIASGTTNAQFFKKLKKKVKQVIEKTVEDEVDNSVGDVIGGKKASNKKKRSAAPPTVTEDKTPSGPEYRKTNSNTTENKKQTQAENQITKNSDTGFSTVSISAYNDYFEPITLLSYKGLPLLGENDKNLVGNTIDIEYNNFHNLLRIKFYSSFINEMDKNVWYQYQYAGQKRYPKDVASSISAQNAIYSAARSLSSLKACELYLNNPKGRHSCYRKIKTWGGTNSSEFRENTYFKKYVLEQLGNLQKYAQKIPTTAYVVDDMRLSTYDYDRKGFVIELYAAKPKIKYTNRLFGAFVPRHDYERHFQTKNQSSFKYLFKIKPERVEALFEGESPHRRTAYFVHKIGWYGAAKTKLYEKYLNDPNMETIPYDTYHRLQYSYADPIIEIYLDPKLTEKIGEINLADLDQNPMPNEIQKIQNTQNQPNIGLENAIPLNGIREKPKIPACTDSKDNRCEEKYLKEWINDKLTNDKLKNWFSQYRSDYGQRVATQFVIDTSGKIHIQKMKPYSKTAFIGIQTILDANPLITQPGKQLGKPVNVYFNHFFLINYNIRKY